MNFKLCTEPFSSGKDFIIVLTILGNVYPGYGGYRRITPEVRISHETDRALAAVSMNVYLVET